LPGRLAVDQTIGPEPLNFTTQSRTICSVTPPILAACVRVALDESDWVLVRREDVRPLILRAIRIDDDGANSGPHTVVILVDLETVPHPTVTALQKIFDLSPAEARVAIEIGCGKSADEIAEATQISV